MRRDSVGLIVRILVAVLLLCSSLALAVPMSPGESLIAAASQQIEDGDYAGALEKLDRAARLEPTDPRPRYLAAVAYEKKGDAKTAERLFREALKLDPKLAEVRAELGALLHDQKRYDEAITELKAALRAKSDLGDAWFNLGQAQLATKRCVDAAQSFSRAAPLQPGQAEPYVQASIALRQCKKIDDALKAARAAVKIAPQSPMAQLNLGITLEKANKLDDARQAYTAATRLKPDYGTAFWSLGLLELHASRAKEAVPSLKRACELGPSPARLTDLGRAYRDLGDLKTAESTLRQAIAKDTRYAPAHFFLAQVLSTTGRCADMDRELAQLPADEARNDDTKKLRADCKQKR
jgi:tetratricopeptide (TPR) repeat protein